MVNLILSAFKAYCDKISYAPWSDMSRARPSAVQPRAGPDRAEIFGHEKNRAGPRELGLGLGGGGGVKWGGIVWVGR